MATNKPSNTGNSQPNRNRRPEPSNESLDHRRRTGYAEDQRPQNIESAQPRGRDPAPPPKGK